MGIADCVLNLGKVKQVGGENNMKTQKGFWKASGIALLLLAAGALHQRRGAR